MTASLIFLLIGIPWAGALLVWLIGGQQARLKHALAAGFSIATAAAAVLLLTHVGEGAVISIPVNDTFGSFTFFADGMSAALAAIAAVIGSLAVIFSIDYMKGEAQLGRYYSLILFFIGSMIGLVLTSNLLLIFTFWEMTALCSYALISFENDNPKAVAGGMKALIITQLGGVGLLLGTLVIYSYLGTVDLYEFLAQAGSLPPSVLSLIAFGFLAAAAAKSSQFPFQTWLPDAMEAPTPISALIYAATMVNAGVYLLARFYPAFSAVPGWKTAVILVGMLSAFLAAVMAMTANDLKRVLAYSTVSQLGYMVYAIGAGGILASQFHLLSHAIFKALLFLAAGAVIHSVGTRDMRQMGGLGKSMPWVRNTFIVGALALAGLPVLNGFWSKEMILEAGLANGPVWAYLVMLLTAGMTAFYTLRCVWLVFFGEARSELHVHPAGAAMRIPLGILALGALTSWLLIGPFSAQLADSLPFHTLEALSIGAMAAEVFTAPATYLALLVIALGLTAWIRRERLAPLMEHLKAVIYAARHSFGFEFINRMIVAGFEGAGEALRSLQTGTA